MKVQEYVEKAEKEIKSEQEEKVIAEVKASLKQIKSAKKTLRVLEESHKKLLEMDVDDLELDGFEY